LSIGMRGAPPLSSLAAPCGHGSLHIFSAKTEDAPLPLYKSEQSNTIVVLSMQSLAAGAGCVSKPAPHTKPNSREAILKSWQPSSNCTQMRPSLNGLPEEPNCHLIPYCTYSVRILLAKSMTVV